MYCPAKESNIMRRPNGKYKNLTEIISGINVLIATYNKLKSKKYVFLVTYVKDFIPKIVSMKK